MALKNNEEGNHGFAISKKSMLFILLGFVIVVIGYILMAGGRSTDPNIFDEKEIFSVVRVDVAPIVILAGFSFILWAIVRKESVSGNTES